MNHWLLMFRPETWSVVQERGVIGVLYMHRRRFAELAVGDRFVAYISKRQVLDGHGHISSAPYEDPTPVFPGRERYPYRADVVVERAGQGVDARELIWDLSIWPSPLKTQPWNMLFCWGGFARIPDGDYARLLASMSAPPPISAEKTA